MLHNLLMTGATDEKLAVEDVFSVTLYTGNGSTQTITNGIDLSGKGGLVWLKNRSGTYSHWLWDTSRGAGYSLNTTNTSGQANIGTTEGVSFSASGFSLGNNINWNQPGTTAVSWTFRKAPKFFDVVTYTGTGSATTINHSLGTTPGMIIVKKTSAAASWAVYHRSNATNQYLFLNATDATATSVNYWNNTAPTSTSFSLGASTNVNESGQTYVAYLFAHDTTADGIVQCGSFTGGASVNLGWEPQFVITKRSNSTGSWQMFDNMRGATADGSATILYANVTNADTTATNHLAFNSTGFTPTFAAAGETSIYLAIRRGPMRTPTDATKVFHTNLGTDFTTITTGFPVDMAIDGKRSGNTYNYMVVPRLAGLNGLQSSSTNAEFANAFNDGAFASNTGLKSPNFFAATDGILYSFRRAPGFFDVVCYTGTGSARTVSHNLGVAPELLIGKARSAANAWGVWCPSIIGTSLAGSLSTTAAFSANGNLTAVSSTTFSTGSTTGLNGSGTTYVAYLFASCPGVSKVGSYTGTGTTQQIDCGFTNGARFVLIKRTDSTGDWWVYDTARGIVSGNDPSLLLNSTAAEVTNTDYIDPYSAGFELSSTAPAGMNANGGTFIYLAIA